MERRSNDSSITKQAPSADTAEDRLDLLIKDWHRERPDLDSDAMAVVGRLLRLGKLLDERINEVLRPYGLLYSEFDVLASLRRSGSPFELTPTELQEAVILTSGAMTALLNRLTDKGLVVRQKSEVDGRSMTARLTPEGVNLANELIELRFEEATQAVSGLTGRQQENLSAQLKTLLLKLGGD